MVRCMGSGVFLRIVFGWILVFFLSSESLCWFCMVSSVATPELYICFSFLDCAVFVRIVSCMDSGVFLVGILMLLWRNCGFCMDSCICFRVGFCMVSGVSSEFLFLFVVVCMVSDAAPE